MGSSFAWWAEHWHSLLESIGIIGGLLFTGVTVRRDLHARRITEHLALANQHRRLWSNLHRRRELSRMLEPDRDLAIDPVSREERLFLELAFVHFQNGWLICREDGALTPLEVLSVDAGHFFTLPVPAAVWAEVRRSHPSEFVSFVDSAVEVAARVSSTGA